MGLLSGNKLIVGYELGNEYCQISYAFSADGAVETLSQVAGEEIIFLRYYVNVLA